MGNKKRTYTGIGVLLFIVTVLLWAVPAGRAHAAEKELSAITAVYTGDTVLVGHSIDLEKLTVMGLYSDGSYVKLKDYVLSSYTVTKKGDNTFSVFCEGVKGEFTVKGKSILRLHAYYSQGSVTIGEKLDREKLTVIVYYSDGTLDKPTDYELSYTLVDSLGPNEFEVSYENETATFTVTGKEERKPRSMFARYNGPAVIVGNAPKRDDFYVTVVFNDNTVERVTEFELTPSVIQKEGSNVVVVEYGELSSEVKIQGLAKTVVSIKAEYTGLPVVVGKAVASEDIKVTATFNDGTKDTVTNFTLSGSVIYKVGDNLITVFCNGKIARINVRGVEAEIIDYSAGVQELIREGTIYSRVKLAVGAKADESAILIDKVDKKLVEKAMHRLLQTDEYMAFEVSFEDPEMDVYLPMTMKVSVPAGFDREKFAVFYTPNRKTIMAEMNGEFLKDGYYEFKIFQPGTYIIADCTPLIYVESLSLEEEELTLRLDRSYSLDPEILPHTATNKEVTYTSSRPNIVTVSEYGTLKALRTGTSIITVEAKDGSGRKCKLRVNVVRKKGKYDADIAVFSDALSEVEDAYDFMDFLDYLAEEAEERTSGMSEKALEAYVRELESWIGGWDEKDIQLDAEEWLLVLELLYERGDYANASLLFGDGAMFKPELRELSTQLQEIKTEEEFLLFSETFFMELEEKLAELEERDAMLYMMALLAWVEEADTDVYEWEDEVFERYLDWCEELELYGF
ncbi:MAG: Ig domain-containing protein [Lachnospiraceae bacterium]|nr:Ig domain-containing protein [Lachnospiraceae bacterium]